MSARPGSLDPADLFDALLAVGRERDLEALLARVAELARAATDARYGAIGVLDEQRLALRRFVTAGIDDETRRRIGEPPRGRGVLGLLIVDPRPLRLARVDRHPLSYGLPLGHPPMSSFLGVPVIVDGQPWGNLYLTDKRAAAEFDHDDERTAVLLAHAAGQAIETVIRSDEAERRRAWLEQRVAALDAAAHVLDASLALGRLDLKLTVKRARALVDGEHAVLLVSDGDALIVAARTGGAGVRSGERVSLPGLERALDPSGRPSPSRDRPAGLARAWERAGLGAPDAVALAPLAFGGRRIGALAVTVAGRDAHAEGAGAEAALEAFVDALAGAIARAPLRVGADGQEPIR